MPSHLAYDDLSDSPRGQNVIQCRFNIGCSVGTNQPCVGFKNCFFPSAFPFNVASAPQHFPLLNEGTGTVNFLLWSHKLFKDDWLVSYSNKKDFRIKILYYSLVDVVVVFIVAAQGDQRSHTETIREENLGNGIHPNL